MQVKYIGDAQERATGVISQLAIKCYGLVFCMGEPVNIDTLTDSQKRKLSNNPTFEVVPDEGALGGDAGEVGGEEVAAPRSRVKPRKSDTEE